MKSRIDKLEYKLKINNNKYYYKNDERHRDKDLPAVVWEDGYRVWYKNGLRHRDNGKASEIYSDGRMFWYKNGKFIKSNYNEIENK